MKYSATEIPRETFRELLDQARAGSTEALGCVFQSCERCLLLRAKQRRRLAFRSKISDSDLVQETFLTAQTALPRFDGSSREEFRAWLFRILDNKVGDVVRRYEDSRKRSIHRELPLREGIAVPSPPPVEQAAEREQEAEIRRALAQLPEAQQHVLVMSSRGNSAADIAEEMGVSQAAVRQLRVRALRTMGKHIQRN